MPEPIALGSLLLVLDLAGTAVFAISGAAAGVRYRLDVFGVCVVAFVAGNAGGMLVMCCSAQRHRLPLVGGVT